jgi:hypothetical protein
MTPLHLSVRRAALLASLVLTSAGCHACAGASQDDTEIARRDVPPDPAPSDPAPSDPAPAEDPAPSDPAPSDPAPSDPAPAEDPAPSDPAPSAHAVRVFYIGHSLQNWTVPTMVASFARASEVRHEFQAQIGNGAPLRWQWERPETAEGVNAQTALPSREYDVLVMTEAVPLAENVRWNETAGFFGRFLAAARRGNPDVQAYLYETWHSRNEPNWRRRLGPDLRVWESVVDQVNAAHDGPDVLLIPGGQAMAALHDRIGAGDVPGLRSMDDVFHDDIHLNATGWYFIALVQYATIHRRSPVGLPARTTDRFGAAHPTPPAEAIPVLQQIAWDVVRRYPRSGVRAL